MPGRGLVWGNHVGGAKLPPDPEILGQFLLLVSITMAEHVTLIHEC